jgi:septal ring factor EnvC (AmiA/AmiB activator)
MKERRSTGQAAVKQFLVAGCLVIILSACLIGIYMAGNIKKENEEPQVAERNSSEEQEAAESQQEDEQENQEISDMQDMQDTQDTQTVTRVVRPTQEETPVAEEPEVEDETVTESETQAPVQTASVGGSAVVADTSQTFSGELVWPLEGSVLMNYSMDQSIYFATLDQYKRNPALIISAGEGTDVAAAAAGTITEISSDAQTGQTLSMDIGDGYTLIYGQLQDVRYNEGAHLDAGDVIGCVAATTKYYSLEGNNLYFAMEKDGSPVDPTEYLPQ